MVVRLLTDVRNLGSSFYHTELERDAAIEQEREIGGTFMNNSHNSQILRPMRLHAASQQQWLAREADDERLLSLTKIILLLPRY